MKSTTTLTWRRGFPSKSGIYLVELVNGEHCVTPYKIPDQEGEDTWGDKRRPGWCCLTGSHATVFAWAQIPNAKAALQETKEGSNGDNT